VVEGMAWYGENRWSGLDNIMAERYVDIEDRYV
jgi:hypothetical protein